jgi:hypothetical protein
VHPTQQARNAAISLTDYLCRWRFIVSGDNICNANGVPFPPSLQNWFMTRIVLRACSLLLILTGSAFAQSTAAIRDYRRANEHRILSEFLELLAIPNVASNREGIARNAELISRMMEKRGLSPRLLYGSDKSVPPLIYGEWKTPGVSRTIVFYAHYDGQPTDPAKWTLSDPWKPVFRNGALDKGAVIVPAPADGSRIDPEYRIYARSASDDKRV